MRQFMDSSKNGTSAPVDRNLSRFEENIRGARKAIATDPTVPLPDHPITFPKCPAPARGKLVSKFAQRKSIEEIPNALKEMLKDGLFILWRGFVYARDLRTEPWQFAVDTDTLYRTGMTSIDLQWLVIKGFVEYESTGLSDQASPASLDAKVLEDARIILTDAGARFVVQIFLDSFPAAQQQTPFSKSIGLGTEHNEAEKVSRRIPKWDAAQKELRVEDLVIKQFRWSAMNQEAILMAFEEEAWPNRIDDPLSQKPGVDPKERLHDTVKCLNRNHRHRVIRFHGDGTGEGVVWTFLSGEAEIDC